MTTEQSEEASKNKGEKGALEEFELWWTKLLKSLPVHFSEYHKIKKLCRDAFLAGRLNA